MKFSYNWLKDYIKGKMPEPKKLGELLTLHLAEVEEIEKKEGDYILDIDIRPNRAGDCFSHLGIAREIALVTNSIFQLPVAQDLALANKKAKDFIAVEVRNKKACPRYTACVLTDAQVGLSPKWLRDRLKACGLNSINNVVDIANYVMLETGQPLHAFDNDKIEGKKIIVRLAKPREKIVTLDEQKFDLTPNILVIADTKKPVAIAGIKGGKLPEIDKKTKNIVLESANFTSPVIRQGSKELDLKTDASLRFEHGLDPNLTEYAINRASYLVQKIAGGKRVPGLVDVYPKKVYPKIIKLDLAYLTSLLGVKVPLKEIKNILKKLDFQLLKAQSQSIKVKVPTLRQDMALAEDLIEEIGRIYGYSKIPVTFPTVSLVPAKRNEEIFWEDMVKNILKEAGFTELYNYSFISETEANTFHYSEKELIELDNPLSQEQKYLRPSLIPNLLKNVQKNQKHFGRIRIFEMGKIFHQGVERRQLSGLISGDEFYQLKGIIDLLLNKLGISDIWYDNWQATPEQSKKSLWHPKKSAEIKVGRKEIGFLGEISPRVLQSLKISDKVVVFDIDFEILQKLASAEHEYLPLSKFPSAVRDLAILVPPQTKVVQVLNKINTVGGSLVRDVDLFDIYQGEELPQGKKNLAFHIIYQSDTRTLTSKEVDGVHQKIIKALEKTPGWQVRK